MANPPGSNAGRQWVEIENTGTDAIDLGAKDIRFFTSSGNHLIKEYSGGGTVLPVGGTGVIFKSSFTLPASGIVGVVKTDGTVLVRKAYVATVTAKPTTVSKSTTKRATARTTSGTRTSPSKQGSLHVAKSYGKGTIAPAAAADATAAGAVFTFPTLLAPFAPLLSSLWFGAYLALIAFSGFSLIVIQRHYL
jgi:hypothetical protein